MSVHISGAVWQLDLTPTQKLVMLALADQANDKGQCWPSVGNIEERTGLDPRTVQRVLRQLEKLGMLGIKQRNGHSSLYQLPVIHSPRRPAPPALRRPGTAPPTPGTTPPPPPAQCHPESSVESIKKHTRAHTREEQPPNPRPGESLAEFLIRAKRGKT